ncbi:MAG: replicative DNA helicase, partial [Cellvibrionaceae bacterium]|nr:replicative DNA helicase [Cellvibrionaceae bacterium]
MSESYPSPSNDQAATVELPHSQESEQAVLGGLLLDSLKFDAVAELLAEKDFYSEVHKLIFLRMSELVAAEKPLDIITVGEELERYDELERCGGLHYLTELVNNTASAANIAAYAHIVRERSTLRQLIGAAGEISRSSLAPAGMDSDDLLQLAERKVAQIAEERPKEGGFIGANDLLKTTVEKIDLLFRSESDITGLSTGLEELDQRTSGWQSGEMVV